MTSRLGCLELIDGASLGAGYMHVSNLYLWLPVPVYGINLYGPMFGFNIRLGKPK